MAKKNLEVIEYIFPDGEGVLGFTHSGVRFKLPNGGEIVAVEPKGKTAIALLQWGGFRDIIHQLMPAWVEWEKPYSLKEDDLCWWDESSETWVSDEEQKLRAHRRDEFLTFKAYARTTAHALFVGETAPRGFTVTFGDEYVPLCDWEGRLIQYQRPSFSSTWIVEKK